MNLMRKASLSIVALATLIACGQAPEGAQPSKAPPSVSVAHVLSEDITEWDEFTGRLEAPQTVMLKPRVSGYINEVAFSEGAEVEQGQLLFVIDPEPFEMEVARLKAQLTQAKSQYQLARSEAERAERLVKQNAISQEVLDTRNSAQTQARASVAATLAALKRAELDLAYTQVKAPISGRVSRALITKGNFVTQGQTLLTSLVSTDKIFAYFDADEQSYLKYMRLDRQGKRRSAREFQHPVFMSLADEKHFPHHGHIDFVDNQISQTSGTIRGRAVFDNRDGMLTPGLFARIKLMGSESYRAVLIDEKAVATDLNNQYVLLVDESGKTQYQSVTLGEKVNGLRIVKSGLKAGDKIVVNGLQRVMPGMQVTPQEVAMAKEADLKRLHAQQNRLNQALLRTVQATASKPVVGS